MRSKFRLKEKVQVTSMELYPNEHHLMGSIIRITGEPDEEKLYDIHYGITGVEDLHNVPEKDIKVFGLKLLTTRCIL